MPRSPTTAILFDAKTLAQLVKLDRDCRWVGRVAGKHFHGNRAAILGTEQAKGDLLLALLAITVVAKGGQGTRSTFHIAGGDIIEDQCATGEMPVGKASFDPWLSLPEPVEHVQQFIAMNRAQREHGAQRGCCRIRGKGPGGGKFGLRLYHPCDDAGPALSFWMSFGQGSSPVPVCGQLPG